MALQRLQPGGDPLRGSRRFSGSRATKEGSGIRLITAGASGKCKLEASNPSPSNDHAFPGRSAALAGCILDGPAADPGPADRFVALAHLRAGRSGDQRLDTGIADATRAGAAA